MSGTTWALVSSTLRAALALSTAASTEERTGWCCECERGWCHGTCGGGPRVVRDPAAVHVQEDLTLALGAVPPHVPPTLALAHRALAQCLLISRHLAWCRHLRGQVRVADHVDVRLQARVDGGAGLEWVEVLRPGPHTHQGRVLVTSPVPGSWSQCNAMSDVLCRAAGHLLVVPALHSHMPHSQWELMSQPPMQVLVR